MASVHQNPYYECAMPLPGSLTAVEKKVIEGDHNMTDGLQGTLFRAKHMLRGQPDVQAGVVL